MAVEKCLERSSQLCSTSCWTSYARRCSSVSRGSGCSVPPSLSRRGRPPLLHPRRALRLGSVRPPIARRASDEELIAAESLALLLTDATWGDPLCSPGRASRISMRDAYKCGFIGCRNATIAASACGDRANGVCGISMDLGLVEGKVSRFFLSFALNFRFLRRGKCRI